MNSLLELNTWVNDIKTLIITDDNLDIFYNFMRFSPEKFADKMDIERGPIVKEFDKHKKEIHNKVILFKKIKELKKRKVESSSFFHQGKQITSKICYCTKFFKIKSVKFYPTIKYLYFYSDNEMIILPDEHRTVIISELEFNEYFIDKREETINKLLTND